jgi:hypothetical protein
MIFIEPEHRLSLTFTNTSESNDITTFVSIIDKCVKEAKKSGFKSFFNTIEKNFIKTLHENLNKGE